MPNQNTLNDTDLDLGNIKRPHENQSNMNKFNAQGAAGGDALHTSATNKSEDIAFKGPPPNNSDP